MAEARSTKAPSVPIIDAAVVEFRTRMSRAGYDDGQISAAIDRARGNAEWRVKPVVTHHDEALYEVMGEELAKAEKWLANVQAKWFDNWKRGLEAR